MGAGVGVEGHLGKHLPTGQQAQVLPRSPGPWSRLLPILLAKGPESAQSPPTLGGSEPGGCPAEGWQP